MVNLQSTKSWREDNGIIYFSVTSDGTTGKEWIDRLRKKGFRLKTEGSTVERNVLDILESTKLFTPTTSITTEIAVIKGTLNEIRTFKNALIRAESLGLQKPNLDVACLIREMFTGSDMEEMGLSSICVMHEPIKFFSYTSSGHQFIVGPDNYLSEYRDMVGGCYWPFETGFAFAVPQI